jgi:leucyl-tRNA synthetase
MALADTQPSGQRDESLDREVQRAIKRVTEDLRAEAFNTAIASMMELSNALQKATGPSRDEGIATLILLLAPFAPHIAEELWHRRGGAGSVHQQAWPEYDPAMAVKSIVTIVVQVSGKVRDRIAVPAGKSKAELERLALASPKVQAALNGAKPSKVIVVPDRLVNVVVK